MLWDHLICVSTNLGSLLRREAFGEFVWLWMLLDGMEACWVTMVMMMGFIDHKSAGYFPCNELLYCGSLSMMWDHLICVPTNLGSLLRREAFGGMFWLWMLSDGMEACWVTMVMTIEFIDHELDAYSPCNELLYCGCLFGYHSITGSALSTIFDPCCSHLRMNFTFLKICHCYGMTKSVCYHWSSN